MTRKTGPAIGTALPEDQTDRTGKRNSLTKGSRQTEQERNSLTKGSRQTEQERNRLTQGSRQTEQEINSLTRRPYR
jgi:hypothetical protein